ncbi:MAG: nucleotide sugar dehydrogenase [Rhodospirillales bacterium]|nr:nucleotide sugar dehydrogenase [Rhodospirillales bacterium]
MNEANFIQRIKDRTLRVGVIGLGYVGLPLVMTFAENGFTASGFDIDGGKITAIESGMSYLSHIPDSEIRKAVAGGKLTATTDFAETANMDALIICVPTPLAQNREPDLHFITDTAETIRPYLKNGQLVVLESTTYPGTTAEVLKPILEADGLKSGEDFLLAYSPEREDPGNANFGTSSIPKIIGGDGDAALKAAEALYGEIVVQTVPVSSMEVAEAVKLTENIFRAVNIALVNELKVVFEKMDIDVWEVIEGAKTKPFGYMPFYPGPGLGGHCIPIDPFYLTWKAKQVGAETKFIELAGEINTAMPGRVVDVLQEALKSEFGTVLSASHILVAGLAYKKNVNDIRESPALAIIDMLLEKGAEVDYYDPFVPVIPNTRDHAALAGRKSIEWSVETLGAFDAALIITDHDDVDYTELAAASRLVIDTRNAMKGQRQDSVIIRPA